MSNRNRITLEGLTVSQATRVRSHYRRARAMGWGTSLARRDAQYLVTSWTARNAIEASRVARQELVHCMHGGHDDNGSGHALQPDCVDAWQYLSMG